MKVLIISGYPVGEHDKPEDLARVWQDDKHRIYVEPVNFAKTEFAAEYQRLINKRIADNPGKKPFFKWGAKYETGLTIDTVQLVGPEDSDFLENFMGDRHFWGPGRVFAGYETSYSGSRIIEE